MKANAFDFLALPQHAYWREDGGGVVVVSLSGEVRQVTKPNVFSEDEEWDLVMDKNIRNGVCKQDARALYEQIMVSHHNS